MGECSTLEPLLDSVGLANFVENRPDALQRSAPELSTHGETEFSFVGIDKKDHNEANPHHAPSLQFLKELPNHLFPLEVRKLYGNNINSSLIGSMAKTDCGSRTVSAQVNPAWAGILEAQVHRNPSIDSSTNNSQILLCKNTLLNTFSASNYNVNYETVLEPSETSSSILPICRICHLPGDEETEILISPCRCSGTLLFIHETCLKKWLEISARKSRRPARCELCHYQYHRHKKFRCHHWRFPRVSSMDKLLHLVFIFNLIIMVVCAVATVMCFLSDKGRIKRFPRQKTDLTTDEIITLACGVLFFVSFFVAMSVQIKARHTIYQILIKFIVQNMDWEIDEYDKSKDTSLKIFV